MKKKPSLGVVVFALLILIDLTLFILHSKFGWSVINLDEEGNLAAWYSSAKLLALSAFAVIIWRSEKNVPADRGRKLTVLWLLVALIFLGLSMDETASLHERLARTVMKESTVGLDIRETVLDGDETKDSFAWVLILSPFILLVALFFLFFFWSRFFPARSGFIASIVALLCFLTAVGLEATIYVTPAFSEWGQEELSRYLFFIGFEEAGELLGSTLFLLAFYRYARYLKRAQTQSA